MTAEVSMVGSVFRSASFSSPFNSVVALSSFSLSLSPHLSTLSPKYLQPNCSQNRRAFQPYHQASSSKPYLLSFFSPLVLDGEAHAHSLEDTEVHEVPSKAHRSCRARDQGCSTSDEVVVLHSPSFALVCQAHSLDVEVLEAVHFALRPFFPCATAFFPCPAPCHSG